MTSKEQDKLIAIILSGIVPVFGAIFCEFSFFESMTLFWVTFIGYLKFFED